MVHTNPHVWLQPCEAGRWCPVANPPADTRCCCLVVQQIWRCRLRLCDKTVCTQKRVRGWSWLGVAASSRGCLWNCGWSDSTLGYEGALWNILHTSVIYTFKCMYRKKTFWYTKNSGENCVNVWCMCLQKSQYDLLLGMLVMSKLWAYRPPEYVDWLGLTYDWLPLACRLRHKSCSFELAQGRR